MSLPVSPFPLQVATPRTSVPRALALAKAPGLSSTRSEAPSAGLSAHSGLVRTSLRCPTLPAPAVSVPTVIRTTCCFTARAPSSPPRPSAPRSSGSPIVLTRAGAGGETAHPPRARAPETSCSALPIRRDACSAVPCRATEQAINIKADPRLVSLESLFPGRGRGGELVTRAGGQQVEGGWEVFCSCSL